MTGVAGLAGAFFVVLSSSDESVSDDESFFFLLGVLVGAGALFAAGVAFARDKKNSMRKTIFRMQLLLIGVEGVCFLLAGGATSSESEVELLDDAALPFGAALTSGTVFEVAIGFFVSSSEESDEEDESFFFLLFPFIVATFAGGIPPGF